MKRVTLALSLVALLLAACGAAESPAGQSTPTSSPPTPTPKPTPTPAPPTPTADPHALTPSNVAASLKDNELPSSDFNALKVTIPEAGNVVIVAKPAAILDEQNLITIEAEDVLTAVKAIKGWYTKTTVIHVQVDTDFTDANGNSKSAPGAWIEYSAATFAPINPDGLTTLAFERPSRAFALADAYYIDPAVWKNIKAEDQSALSDNSASGSPLIAKIPG